ncbi:kinase-like domain-containing protein [Nemania diffusa]|nr:kinase-like domain-containing protein [Nemania diffusa]
MSITQPKVLPETLSYRLRSVLVRAEGPANYFLPLDQLNNILDQPSVKDEIITLFPEQPPEQRDELVDRICGPEGKPQLGLCRKVFAVLLMSSQGRSISQFIAQNISDADIPLEPISEPNNITGLQRKVKSDSMPIKLDGWDHNNYMNFLLYQRQVNVPFFTNDASRKDEIPILEEQTILPWVKDTTPTDGPIHSGHSEVRAICIHKGHHNFPNTYSQSVFALKKLHMRDPKDIDPEIKTLRRFSLEDQAHLIQLLTAFYWNNECHLLFPWAHGGSLEDLWRKHDNPPLTKELMVWVSKQCHGIATGLHQIHERQLSDRSLAVRTDRESSRVRGNMEFGLHGDIKPANILWFKKPQERLGAGDLKICDFGLVKFHERETAMRSVVVVVVVVIFNIGAGQYVSLRCSLYRDCRRGKLYL